MNGKANKGGKGIDRATASPTERAVGSVALNLDDLKWIEANCDWRKGDARVLM